MFDWSKQAYSKHPDFQLHWKAILSGLGEPSVKWHIVDSQAGAISRIRRRIFVRRKSAEKNSASRIHRQIFVRQKPNTILGENTVTLLLYQYATQWWATELRDGPCDIVIPLFASEKFFHAALQSYLRKNIGSQPNFSRIFYLSR